MTMALKHADRARWDAVGLGQLTIGLERRILRSTLPGPERGMLA